MNTVLLVERSNRFRARQFAARGMHGLVSKGVIDVAENRLDQVAAVVDLSKIVEHVVGGAATPDPMERYLRRRRQCPTPRIPRRS